MYDQYYNDVSLLLHMNGANGSTTFTDDSANAFTVSATATISTANYKFGGASGLFNGTTDYLSVPSNSVFDFGTGDFTIETFIRPSTVSVDQNIWSQRPSNISGGSITFRLFGSKLNFFYGAGLGSVTGSTDLVVGNWYHVVLTREGNVFKLWLNGQLDGTSSTITDSLEAGIAPNIGRASWNGEYFSGNIDELRVTKGVARYLTDFTPPLQQFPDSAPEPATWIDTTFPGFPANGIANDYGASNTDGTVLVASNVEPESSVGYIWTSTDAGGTWTKVTAPGSQQWNGFACSADGSKMVAVAFGGSIWTSSNYGVTWTERSAAGTKDWNGVCCSYDGAIIYAVDLNGLCYKSDDSGVTWAATDSTATDAESVACSDDGSVVLVGTDTAGDLFLSTNGGTSWTSVLTSVSSGFVAVAMDSVGQNMVAVEKLGDVFVSNDGGNNWSNMTNNPQTNSYNAFVSSLGETMIVNYTGANYFSYDYGAIWVEDTNCPGAFLTGDKTSGTMLLAADVDWWVYEGAMPSGAIFTITSITPDHGPTVGGTPVTITGVGFYPTATAAIDGNDLTDLVVVDTTTITGVTPAGTVGAKNVTVTQTID
jgi:hypothetical protein